MEFERAIFRVYERCLDGLRDEVNNNEYDSKGCRFLEFIMLSITSFLLLSLVLLHSQFVHSAGCLPYLLSSDNNVTYNASSLLNYDQILNINLDRRFLPNKPETSNNLRNSLHHILLSNDSLASNNTSFNNSSVASNKVADFDYQFSFEIGELYLSDKIRQDHHFEIINVTMTGVDCFGGPAIQSLIFMGGMDSVVINALMYTFQKPGGLITGSGDYYRWYLTDIYAYLNVGQMVAFKLNMLATSIGSFFFLSTITALLVRILISSGVVLMFPLFHLIQYFGMQLISLRIITISYPWIGVPMEMMRARNLSTVPFLIAHLTRVVLYYVLYQAVQTAFSEWFYRPNISPGQAELWLFALMMIVEYYSMIYMRAKGSIQLFPRAFLALFLVFHFYYYSYPSGFHLLALSVVVSMTIFLMATCIRQFEIKAYYTGNISIDSPRMLFNQLPWPTMRTELASDLTLFMPVTSEAVGIYQTNVPALGNNNEAAPAVGDTGSSTTTALGAADRPLSVAVRSALFGRGVLEESTTSTTSAATTTAVVADIETGLIRNTRDSSSFVGNSSLNSRGSGGGHRAGHHGTADIELTTSDAMTSSLPPSYHDPDLLLSSPSAGSKFRKVPHSSTLLTNSHSGSLSSSKRGDYARVDNSLNDDSDNEEDV